MSNVLKDTPFFPVPQHLVKSGQLGKLTEGATKLYLLILFDAQHRTRIEMEFSNADIRALASLSPNTIRRARTELMEAGLIRLSLEKGGRYTYVLLNPVTRGELPRPDGRGRASPAVSVKSSTPTVSIGWADIGRVR